MLTFRSDALSMMVIACRPIEPTERIPANPPVPPRHHRFAFPGALSWLTRGPPRRRNARPSNFNLSTSGRDPLC